MSWPKLSESLPCERDPHKCQGCGATENLTRWRECNDNDLPTIVCIVVCPKCSKQIGPHPRLYVEMDPCEPQPGAMAPCVMCAHRDGLTCTCPQAGFNGGPGLEYDPMPSKAFVCCRGRGKKNSGIMWAGPAVKTCSGFAPKVVG